MSIKLFEHNKTAYDLAIAQLAETGKTAIIHPTGTGKSFIGFKLCEDFPDKTVCWISPSEYIFRTQLENLRAVSDGYEPENIRFVTYAKLMFMDDEELSALQPDYIVLDEFHRCGAEMWGQGVQKLLNLYCDVPVLGLSATAVRYLDNQRDMAEELFDGCVASEITLGESIVRGILNPPKYVLSVFAYQKELDRYEVKVKRAKNRAVRDEAEMYLEALRRAIDKADGLDKIFEKHMTDRTGKYLVFCAGVEHMREMMAKSKEWFSGIDQNPHVYTFYTEDPKASKSFDEFRSDDDNTHLRLLYCIDALNEGVHVEDVSGVILLRPTVSPIIYKQQIGRALSASKRKDAVIFDVVMNIENLYSIDSLKEEMRVAMTYYRTLGEGEDIVNERFEIIDEVRSCREIFEKLNDTLTASWDLMYAKAAEYFTVNGDLDVPQRYRTAEGYSLGSWIGMQRKIYRGDQAGRLGEERIAKLNQIGMIWDNRAEQSWKKYYAAACRYKAEHGNLDVAANNVTNEGVALGRWICQLRCYRKSGHRLSYITAERIAQLDKLGMIWDVPDYQWEQNFNAAMQYHREYGDLNPPVNYVDPNGVKLGMWLNNMRRSYQGKHAAYKLTDEQITRLTLLGMNWENRQIAQWEKGFAEATAYRSKYGNLNVPASYETAGGYKLGDWIRNQREKYRTGKLTRERIERLSSLGMRWKKEDPWEIRFRLAEQYFLEYGDLRIPANYKVSGVCLTKWVNEQKQAYRGNRKQRLTNDQIKRLEAIGIEWTGRAHKAHAAAVNLAV